MYLHLEGQRHLVSLGTPGPALSRFSLNTGTYDTFLFTSQRHGHLLPSGIPLRGRVDRRSPQLQLGKKSRQSMMFSYALFLAVALDARSGCQSIKANNRQLRLLSSAKSCWGWTNPRKVVSSARNLWRPVFGCSSVCCSAVHLCTSCFVRQQRQA